MHDYSIDKHPKEVLLFILAFIAISAAPPLNRLIAFLVEQFDAWTGLGSPVFTAVPVFGLFAFLYFLFNKYLWRSRSLRKLLLVPDLNGIWHCTGQTVMKEGQPANAAWNGEVSCFRCRRASRCWACRNVAYAQAKAGGDADTDAVTITGLRNPVDKSYRRMIFGTGWSGLLFLLSHPYIHGARPFFIEAQSEFNGYATR